MKNWIKMFLNDERGAESTELAITGLVVAGGSVAGFTELKDKVEAKGDELIGKLDAANGN
jgi:Flp pilus assembly pilin Flp